MTSGGESKTVQVSGAAWSASVCPKGNWTVSSSSLLSCVALKAVGRASFFQGKAGGPPLPWHGVTPPHRASHQCTPWGLSMEQICSPAFFCSLHTALGFARVGQCMRPQGMGERGATCSYCLWPGLPLPPTSSRGEQMFPQVISTCLVVLCLLNTRLLTQGSRCLRHLKVHP